MAGRKAIFGEAMTAAERQRRKRADGELRLMQVRENLASAHDLLRAYHDCIVRGELPSWNQRQNFLDAVAAIEQSQALLGSNNAPAEQGGPA